MLTLAAELINENGISTIALAAFGILIPMVGAIVVAMIQQRGKILELREIAKLGFAESVTKKLDRLEEMLSDHIEWHLHQKKEEK